MEQFEVVLLWSQQHDPHKAHPRTNTERHTLRTRTRNHSACQTTANGVKNVPFERVGKVREEVVIGNGSCEEFGKSGHDSLGVWYTVSAVDLRELWVGLDAVLLPDICEFLELGSRVQIPARCHCESRI